MNLFYLNQEWLRSKGYIRTIVYRFRQGNSNPNQEGTFYVKATVEHLFRNDSDITFEDFKAFHTALLTQTIGKFSDTFSVVPTSLVESKKHWHSGLFCFFNVS